MLKERKVIIKQTAIFEILLLISFSFAVAFIFSEYVGFVSGRISTIPTGKTAAVSGKIGGKGFSLFGKELVEAGAGSHLLSGLAWGGAVAGIFKLLGSFGVIDKGLADSLSLASFTGVMGWQGAHAISAFVSPTGASTLTIGVAPLIGLGIGVAVFIATYKKEKKELVSFECLPYEAPLGGNNCELCNDPNLPCSEYRCKSLGQACVLENVGTENEICIWKSKDDTSAPKIEPWDEALKPEGLEYVPDRALSPPNRGFKLLKRPAGCLDPFTKLQFGILTDEQAQCRIDYELTNTYDEMSFLFGETNLFLKEHNQSLKVPSPFVETGDVPEIHNDGTYQLWVRCIDANGNGQDAAAVSFSFCVEPGPDTTQPQIEGTSIENGQPVSFNADEVPIEVYVNEPAGCKWSKQDKDYDFMENEMICQTESYQINAELNYVCFGRLTGIENREDNAYYFRCKDKPNSPENERNVMTTSHLLVLRGSEELVIDDVGPTGEFSGSTTVVEVILTAKTSHGANEGRANCYLASDPSVSDNFIPMQNTGSFAHNQSLFLPAGEYTYYFRCIDAGGNTAEDSTTFSVEVDLQGPSIARVYKDGSGLKIITNERAECVYSLTTCNFNFEDGLPMLIEDPTTKDSHFTEWDESKTYHIKCRDEQGNQPSPDQCNIIAKGSEL
ncbi:hypothetical protein J4462_02415 [Candidatus Pacearchaeota archaeon]|nr:hypothetical protein [Candidatus Pacearchaeota archaeon]